MTPQFSTCDGGKCQSMKNCRRYTERNSHESVAAALWLRREAGTSACDMYPPIEVVSTFNAEEK